MLEDTSLEKRLHRGLRALPAGVLLVALATCNEGGGGGGAAVSEYWVSIDSTSTRVSSTSADLYGSAECDACPPAEFAFGYCPPIHGPFVSDIDVLWSNLTTGQTASAHHGISGHCGCLFSYCTVSYRHGWSATVPLAMGPNVIEIVALGPTSEPGTDTITITRTPAAPEGVEADAAHGEITLRWDPVAEATAYNLYWSTSPTLDVHTASQIPGVVSPFQHSNLTDGVTYFYAVTAASGVSESAPSDVAWATSGWHAQDVLACAAPWQFADTSIATDSLDHVHIHTSRNEQVGATVQQRNDYVTDSQGVWMPSFVGLTAGVDADLALDSSDVAHVSYVGFAGVTHAVDWFGSWISEVVDDQGTCDSSLALDSSNSAHLAYRAVHSTPVPAGELRYASNASGAWLVEVVDAADLGCDTSVAVSSLDVEGNGTPHIAYAGAAPSYGLRYATKSGGTWEFSTIDAERIVGLSLARGANGTLHVAFTDVQGLLRHARREASGAWTLETVDDGGANRCPSLAVDAAGAVHVSYYAATQGGQLRYATNSAGAWHILRIDRARYADTALAVDSHGKVHITYFGDAHVRHATNR